MDLLKLDLAGNAELGFDLTIVHPVSRENTDVVFNVVGSDSKVYRKARNDAVKLASKNKDSDPDDISAAIYARCVTGWSNVTENGKEVKFSVDKAEAMFKKLNWLMDQVGVAIETRANFTKPTENS